MDLTALDVRYVVQELRLLKDAKVEKVLQHDAEKRDILVTMYLQGWPKLHLRLLPGLIALQETKPGHYPKSPPGFAMFLRKYLVNARVQDARQRGFDRVIELDVAGKHGSMTLVIELLPPGNVILILDGKIKGLLENQHYKDRTLRGGIPYEPPPAGFDPVATSDEELARVLTESTKRSIVTALAIELGLGGAYAEEACVRADVEKTRADLSQDEIARVVAAVRSLFAEEIRPHRDAERVYPFSLRTKELEPAEPRFLQALGANLHDAPVIKEVAKPKKDKLAVMMEAQAKQMDRFRKDAEECQRAGERIYETYGVVQELIATAQKARAEKRDVLQALGGRDDVKGYDPATGELEVEL